MNNVSFNERVAIVTGSGGGIGREYALELARRGAAVVVNDPGVSLDGQGNNQSAADQVVEQILSEGGKAVASYDSVATMEGGENIVKTAVEHFGKIDILINNAGILRDRTFLKMTEEEWDQVVNVHLKGAFCITKPAAAVMKANNYGRIIMTASTSGLYGNFGQSNYSAAKMGQVGLMNVLKLELAKYNIKVNTVAPNADSRMTKGLLPEDVAEKLKPKFNVPLVVYLSSEENQESGTIFTMSAGWFARTAIVSGEGVCLGDTVRDISTEEIREKFKQILNIEKAQPYPNATDLYSLSWPLMA